MELFPKDLMHEEYNAEKVQNRKRQNILIAYRGLLFLIERQFEVFMNVILFEQIIQNIIVGNFSEEMILCLIRAGMVLTIKKKHMILKRHQFGYYYRLEKNI